MTPAVGRAPIVDFDGTLAVLDISWADLRRELGVRRIDDLWSRGDQDAWQAVRIAEERAGRDAMGVAIVLELLAAARSVAILTSNSEHAVARFLERHLDLAAQVRVVVGRETLNGPKGDFPTFARGFEICVEATAAEREAEPVVYIGDMRYELEFARRLGATTIDVADLSH